MLDMILSPIMAMINPIMPNCKTNTSIIPISILEIIAAILPYEKTCGLQPKHIAAIAF